MDYSDSEARQKEFFDADSIWMGSYERDYYFVEVETVSVIASPPVAESNLYLACGFTAGCDSIEKGRSAKKWQVILLIGSAML